MLNLSIIIVLSILAVATDMTTPAHAQIRDIIGGIVNEAINSNQRKRAQEQQRRQQQQRQRQQQQQIDNRNRQIQNQRREAERQRQAEQRQKQHEENERKVANYKRMQVALKTLGFYKSRIDGDFGSGSQKAYREYIKAFEVPNSDFNFADVFKMEEHARSGWRSLAEMREALNGGFNEREEYLEARKNNFISRDTWIEANRKGFNSKTEYNKFLTSGISDPNEYRSAMQKLEQRKRALEFCQAAISERKWIEAEKECNVALLQQPNNPTITVSYNRAVREVDRIVEQAFDDKQAALDIIQPAEGSVSDNGTEVNSEELSKAQDTLNRTNKIIASVELRRAVGRCEGLVQEKLFSVILNECTAALSNYQDIVLSDPELIQSVKTLTKIVENSQTEADVIEKAAKIEQQKLALSAAKERSKLLIDELTLFISNGNRFEQQLSIAQGLANLRSVQDNPQIDLLEAAANNLESLLLKENVFVTFRQTRLAAEKTAKTRALLQTRYNVEKMNAFIQDFVSANIVDERVGSLLELQKDLESTLSNGNEDRLKTINIASVNNLKELGLEAELNSYVYTPDGIEVSKEDVVDAANDIELQKLALNKAEKSANELLTNVNEFSKNGNIFSKPLEIAPAIASLRLALNSKDTSQVTLEVSKLNELLEIDTAYINYIQALNSAANAGLANAVAEEKDYLKTAEKYLVQFISQNVTSENIGELIELRNTILLAIESASDATLVKTAESTRVFFDRNGLSTGIEQFIQTSANNQINSNAETASNGLSINVINKYILEGHPEDVIVLRNSTANAPNIGKNILGNIIFDNKQAALCWAHEKPEINTSLRLKFQKLRTKGAEVLEQKICHQSDPLSFDLVALERGTFLSSSVEFANKIVGMFEEKKLVKFISITKHDIDRFNSENIATSEILSREIEAGLREGYGIIQLSNNSNILCVTPENELQVHSLILADLKQKLEILLLGNILMAQHSLDEAYVLSQRDKCGSIYASASDLKTLLIALEREGQPHTMIPEWVSIKTIDSVKQYLINAQNASDEELAKLSQEREARIALEQAKAEETETIRKTKEQDLRNTHRDAALGLSKLLGTSVSNYVLEGVNNTEINKFTYLTSLVEGLYADRWKFLAVDPALIDYGLAKWKDRKLPIIIERVFIKSQNAIKGEYRTDCMFVGYMVDTEFDIKRDHLNVSCEEEMVVAEWLKSRRFQSLWNVN